MPTEENEIEIYPSEEFQKPNYLHLFEERIERLAPLPEHRTIEIAEKFGLDKIGLYPIKFVASVLYAPPETEILRYFCLM